MSSISRSHSRPRTAFVRLLVLAGITMLGRPDSGRAAALQLPAVAPPTLPPGEGPAATPRSYLQARLTVPIEAYRHELDRLLPREIRAAGIAEQVTPEEVWKEEEREAARAGVRWRGPILRGSLASDPRGDTLYTRTTVHYRLDIEGEGFAPTSCGVEADSLTGLVGVMTRFAWGEGWRLESRSSPLAVIYPTRCKPRPPAINFTKLVDDRIKSRFIAHLLPTLDSLTAATDLAPRVNALHAGLARPVRLGGGAWLHWRPGEVRAERPRLEGDALVIDLAFEAAPTILPSANGTAVEFPGAPTQRLFDSDTYVPVDCWVDFAEIASRLVGIAAPIGTGGGESLRVAGATVRGARDRLALELELEGALTGRAFLVGKVHCAEPDFALELPDLAWSEESRQAVEDLVPAGEAMALRAALDELLEQAKSRLRFDLSRCVVQWNQAVSSALAAPPAGEAPWRAGFNQREVSDIFCTDRAIGVRVIERGRVRRAD